MTHAHMLSDALFLFDIDGTLLDVKGDGKRALLAAITEVLNVCTNAELPLKGAIDRLIFRGFYESTSLPAGEIETHWTRFKNRYLEGLYTLNGQSWVLFPNAAETVKYLHSCSNIAVATGNIRPGADVKLAHFGLDGFFSCGGYGDEADDRAHLVQMAIRDAEAHYGRGFDPDRIFMLGDTEKDVRAAHDNGIVPVLIDHYGAHESVLDEWNVRYYGTFAGFDAFLSHIAGGTSHEGVFRF